jgi:phosphoribosylformimino-5-aminoimidazole carboxamide ribotide isomerase
MKVFPAVDILGGRCVQLVQGKRESATDFGDPLSCATRWLEEGATALHVINLDGAFGKAQANAALIRDLVDETGVEVQLGGGIRSIADAMAWLETGVDRIIIGTLATEDPEVLGTLASEYGSARIMAGVDARDGQIAVEGWQQTRGDFCTWAARFEKLGAGSLLYTNVDIEGLQQGIRLDPVKELIRTVSIPVVVAGGVSSPADLQGLHRAGAAGAVLGSALYSGKITLEEALKAIQ